MKILYYNHTGQVSGAERVLFTLIHGMGPHIEASLIAPASGHMLEFSQASGVRFRPIRELEARFSLDPRLLAKYMCSVLATVRDLRRCVNEENPEVLHANSVRAGIVASIATVLRRTVVIWHVHDCLPEHIISTLIRFLLVTSSRNRVIAVSSAAADRLRGKLLRLFQERVPVVVVHNGVKIPEISRADLAATDFRVSQNIPPDSFVACMVGQIAPRKGQLEAVRAFWRFLKTGFPNAHMLVAGEAKFDHDLRYYNDLVAEVERLELTQHVIFLGQRSDIEVIFAASDAILLNSRSEPFSLVLLEAAARELPIIATNVDGVPELVVDGLSGRLYRFGDDEALVQILRELAMNPVAAAQLGRAGRQRVVEQFSELHFLNQMTAAYRKLWWPS